MSRAFGSLLVGLLAAGASQGHFPFILPDESGAAAKVVFSDSLAPDPDVKIEKLESTKLFLRDDSGKDPALEWKKGDACLEVKVPGKGLRTVYGVTEYGVLQKGDAKPFRLVYFPKAIVGGSAAKAVGDPLKVEIVPATANGKTRFQVLLGGKPVPDAETTVLVPEKDKQMVKTDREGFTPAYEAKGRYGVYSRVTEAKAGEYAGKKYEESRYYATLVVEVK